MSERMFSGIIDRLFAEIEECQQGRELIKQLHLPSNLIIENYYRKIFTQPKDESISFPMLKWYLLLNQI